MGAGLQHQLTTLAVRAFFEGQFAEDPEQRDAADAFLTRVLPGERPEVAYIAASGAATKL